MDRLAQFQASSGLPLLAGVPPPGSSSNTFSPVNSDNSNNNTIIRNNKKYIVEITDPPTPQDAEAAEMLEDFYKLVEEANKSIERVAALTRDIIATHSEIMSTVDTFKCNTMRREVEELENQVNDAARTSSQLVDSMKKATEKLKENPERESQFIGVVRIQENQRRYILQRLSAVMEGYQKQQALAEDRYRKQTERQIKIKYTNPDGSAIDDNTAKELALEVLENNATSAIFQQSKDVLAQIIETRNDIYRIEQSMRSLNQLFNDLAFLVHEQGEIMDVILKNIENATRFVEAGRKELKKARKYQKKSRKKLCCFLVMAAIIILIVVAVVLGLKL
ncbi:Target SNARE coiled-coil homology domain [Trypanosoma melophagium]|uniref:Target SNARE coiled-coil homology domain n=1 Tax=Trypanosoma melophagium TaxID=715481 RepID=UPI003519EF2A|nr:Target SNARE coiled-coil homology domain [Trypanosoma melophagium]